MTEQASGGDVLAALRRDVDAARGALGDQHRLHQREQEHGPHGDGYEAGTRLAGEYLRIALARLDGAERLAAATRAEPLPCGHTRGDVVAPGGQTSGHVRDLVCGLCGAHPYAESTAPSVHRESYVLARTLRRMLGDLEGGVTIGPAHCTATVIDGMVATLRWAAGWAETLPEESAPAAAAANTTAAGDATMPDTEALASVHAAPTADERAADATCPACKGGLLDPLDRSGLLRLAAWVGRPVSLDDLARAGGWPSDGALRALDRLDGLGLACAGAMGCWEPTDAGRDVAAWLRGALPFAAIADGNALRPPPLVSGPDGAVLQALALDGMRHPPDVLANWARRPIANVRASLGRLLAEALAEEDGIGWRITDAGRATIATLGDTVAAPARGLVAGETEHGGHAKDDVGGDGGRRRDGGAGGHGGGGAQRGAPHHPRLAGGVQAHGRAALLGRL